MSIAKGHKKADVYAALLRLLAAQKSVDDGVALRWM